MIPKALLSLIRKFEGLRLKAYFCPAGVATIGYGHTGPDVSIRMAPITEPMADAMMLKDADIYTKASGNLSPVLWFDEKKHAAIADFCFNLGSSRYKSSTLRRRVNAGNWPAAANELQKWVWGGGRKLPGLVARRAAEAQLLR